MFASTVYKMHRITGRLAMTAALATLALSPTVHAEQDVAIGSGNSASANLDFRISIPSFLVFRLGSAGGTVDLIDFDLVAAGVQSGAGTPVTATAGSGDQGNGAVTVGLLTNANGNLSTTVTAAATGLSDGGSNNIPFSEISTDDTGATLQAPQLTNGTSAAVTTAVSGITNTLSAGESWTYSFDNTSAYPAGTYGGINTTGGMGVGEENRVRTITSMEASPGRGIPVPNSAAGTLNCTVFTVAPAEPTRSSTQGNGLSANMITRPKVT